MVAARPDRIAGEDVSGVGPGPYITSAIMSAASVSEPRTAWGVDVERRRHTAMVESARHNDDRDLAVQHLCGHEISKVMQPNSA